MILTFEKIRVGARMKLVGRVKTGNMLVAFSFCLRVAVYSLAGLTVIRFKYFYSSGGGRVMLLLCAVAVLLVAGKVAHSVDYNGVFTTGCTHHRATRTHTKAVTAVSVITLMHQFVASRWQILVGRAILGVVDKFPWMLHS